MHIVYLGVGSNIGNKLKNCLKGIDLFIELTGSSLNSCSQFYKTEPLYYIDQDYFVNGVFNIITDLDYLTIFKIAKEVEKKLGRNHKSIRYGPRIIDIDLLFYDDLVVNTEILTIPHPNMHERTFVLKPFCDINPEWKHPVIKKTVLEMLNMVSDKSKVVLIK